MRKTLVTLACLAVLSGTTACKARNATFTPEVYLPLVALSLQSGETAAYIVRDEKLAAQDYEGCVLSEVIAGGFRTSSQALTANMVGEVEFPALKVDLTSCAAFKPQGYVLTAGSAEVVDTLTVASLSIAEVYAARLRVSDCPKGTAAVAALAYMRGLTQHALTFMSNPQPVFEYEARVVDFQQCWG